MINKPTLGQGIFTIPEAAMILAMPTGKVNQWIKKYWEMEFVKFDKIDFDTYIWGDKKDKAFNFFTLIELISVKSFRDLGLSFHKIKKAHDILSDLMNIPFPFATSNLLSDGKTIFLDEKSSELLGVDKKFQYSFRAIVSPYCKKLEFETETLIAKRYWPLGKSHNIVVDPNHSFGQPTIIGTNITVYAVQRLLIAGESKDFISKAFEISTAAVDDVCTFVQRSAA